LKFTQNDSPLFHSVPTEPFCDLVGGRRFLEHLYLPANDNPFREPRHEIVAEKTVR
jgi:hypothetical protein